MDPPHPPNPNPMDPDVILNRRLSRMDVDRSQILRICNIVLRRTQSDFEAIHDGAFKLQRRNRLPVWMGGDRSGPNVLPRMNEGGDRERGGGSRGGRSGGGGGSSSMMGGDRSGPNVLPRMNEGEGEDRERGGGSRGGGSGGGGGSRSMMGGDRSGPNVLPRMNEGEGEDILDMYDWYEDVYDEVPQAQDREREAQPVQPDVVVPEDREEADAQPVRPDVVPEDREEADAQPVRPDDAAQPADVAQPPIQQHAVQQPAVQAQCRARVLALIARAYRVGVRALADVPAQGTTTQLDQAFQTGLNALNRAQATVHMIGQVAVQIIDQAIVQAGVQARARLRRAYRTRVRALALANPRRSLRIGGVRLDYSRAGSGSSMRRRRMPRVPPPPHLPPHLPPLVLMYHLLPHLPLMSHLHTIMR